MMLQNGKSSPCGELSLKVGFGFIFRKPPALYRFGRFTTIRIKYIPPGLIVTKGNFF
jgi:hypothetical protein